MGSDYDAGVIFSLVKEVGVQCKVHVQFVLYAFFAWVELTTLMIALFHCRVPVSPVSESAHRSGDTDKPKLSAAIVNVICYSCHFPARARQTVCCEKGIRSRDGGGKT